MSDNHDKVFYSIILLTFLFVAFEIGRIIGEAKYCKGVYSYDFSECKGISNE